MAKKKEGLQKDVSTIFGDVQFQKETGYSNLPDAPAQNPPESLRPKPTRLKSRHPVIKMLSSPDKRRRAQKRFRSIQPGKPPAPKNNKNSGG